MPELPEVETIKRQLEKSIVGKKIESVDIQNVEILFPPKQKESKKQKKISRRFINVSVNNFKKRTSNTKIKAIKRRAKLLIIELVNGYGLFIHLGMTGHLLYFKKTNKNFNKHDHIIYTFDDGSKLFHNDSRRIGCVKIAPIKKGKNYIEKKYGPEPLDKNFTIKIFKKILNKKPRQKIKQFLMDQKNIAGIGNLYADEICFFAGIRPTRIVSTLTENEIKNIFKGIKKILSEAIKYHGSSVDNYLDARGREGGYHLRLKVYGRAGKPCKKCSAKIQKIRLAGRGTHFCPQCQK